MGSEVIHQLFGEVLVRNDTDRLDIELLNSELNQVGLSMLAGVVKESIGGTVNRRTRHRKSP